MADFTPEQLERYSRQILLPGVGGRGQRRLMESRVCVVGAGGLGSPVLLYLAGAGVGTLDVVDSDAVEVSNLHRQIVHATPAIGSPKAGSAREALERLNPGVRIVPHAVRLTAENAGELIGPANVVVDGSDNYATRYALSDAALRLGKPLVSGALFRHEGQVAVFPNDGGAQSPCYRCAFPTPPAPGAVPSCSEAGILGPIAGIVGSIQAAEVMKLLLGIGESLAARLLVVDALSMEFRTIRLRRNPACEAHAC